MKESPNKSRSRLQYLFTLIFLIIRFLNSEKLPQEATSSSVDPTASPVAVEKKPRGQSYKLTFPDLFSKDALTVTNFDFSKRKRFTMCQLLIKQKDGWDTVRICDTSQ